MADSKGKEGETTHEDEVKPSVPSTEEIILQTVNDYSKYLKLDVRKERATMEDSVEDMLMKLDEFISSVNMIRDDSSLCLNSTIPNIHAKSVEMRRIFNKIDQLEVFVTRVKQDVTLLEDQVNTAETELELGSLSSIKKAFSSLPLPFTKKTVHTPQSEIKKYHPPEIFKTEDYFSKSETSEQEVTAKR